ncbi:MAG: pyridoxal 5'-phosphate synthase glutaminase subunit PdxT [Acidobacteriota bacterium]
MRIGVLALQGDFAKHGEALTRLGVDWREVRTPNDLTGLDGIIIPGGESTTMLRLMRDEGLFEPLRQFVNKHTTFGTCAGAILLAREVHNPLQESLQAMDITIERNAYGRQIDSFTTSAQASALGNEPVELVFIRAPIIVKTGADVTVLAKYQDQPILVRQGHMLAATFHPELTTDTRIHKLFLNMVEEAMQQ